MTQDELKAAVAREAMKYVVEDAVIGVGTGSTADLFIDELAKMKGRILGTVASSERELPPIHQCQESSTRPIFGAAMAAMSSRIWGNEWMNS